MHVHVCVFVHIHVCMHVYVCACRCVCRCVWVCLTKQLKKGAVLILGGDVIKSTNVRHWEISADPSGESWGFGAGYMSWWWVGATTDMRGAPHI